jgi:hypothetical protein
MIPGTTDGDTPITAVGTARGIIAAGTVPGTTDGIRPGTLPGTIPHSTILGIMVTADGTVVDITGDSTTDITRG